MRAVKAKIITAIALGCLAGSASVVGAQEDLMEPEAATGHVSPLLEEPGSKVSFVGPGVLHEGRRFTQTWEATDPRLSGEVSVTANTIQYATDEMEVGEGAFSLENDGGRWTGPGTFVAFGPLAHLMVTLHGEDGYAGLTAHVLIDLNNDYQSVEDGTFGAAIFPGEIPELLPVE